MGCQSEDSELSNQDSSDKIATHESQELKEMAASKGEKKTEEQPQKILLSETVIPLSTLDPDQSIYVFMQLSGTLINIAKDNSWAVISDGDKQYFAFGHAGMEMFTPDSLGQPVYIRAAVEKLPIDDRLFKLISSRGLAPDRVSHILNRDYQLNTTKFAVASSVSQKDFEFMHKL
ncbi:MAG: hypothetical protein DWP95_07130 [Proteobacteria bacterium]|nr:MAG: hypothetical protein DWP95_07130 [Pseudomonadota bacterium]